MTPEGDLVVLGPDDAFDHVLEDALPEVNTKWEKEWEPAGLEFPEEAVEYALNKGWVMVFDRKLPDGRESVEVTATVVPSKAALNRLRVILDEDKVLCVHGPNQRTPERVPNVQAVLLKLAGE